MLFVGSGVLFITFFWAFFSRRLPPTNELGSTWPTGIQPSTSSLTKYSNPSCPRVTVPWAHHGLLENNATQATEGLFFTVLLEIYFIALQAHGYIESPFTITDSAYRLTFSIPTGFHGLRVIIGTTFLITCLQWHNSTLLIKSWLWIQSNSMVPTFCRRSLIIWIHPNLLMRKIK